LGGATELQMPPDKLPNWRGYKRVAVVLSHSTASDHSMIQAISRSLRLVSQQTFSSQNAIQVLIFENTGEQPLMAAK
jgi:hypothetical protein